MVSLMVLPTQWTTPALPPSTVSLVVVSTLADTTTCFSTQLESQSSKCPSTKSPSPSTPCTPSAISLVFTTTWVCTLTSQTTNNTSKSAAEFLVPSSNKFQLTWTALEEVKMLKMATMSESALVKLRPPLSITSSDEKNY